MLFHSGPTSTVNIRRRKEQEEKLRVLLAEVEAELRSRGASPEVQWLSFSVSLHRSSH